MKFFYRFFLAFRSVYFNPFLFIARLTVLLPGFILQKKNTEFHTHLKDFYPCITDKTEKTPLDPIYFFQDAWCASLVFKNRPGRHYDVGSNAHMLGILSQFVPVTMIDIRPLPVKLEELNFVEGNILAMPFADSSIESLSSICVIEHIGLGRYGDKIDAFGSEKAAHELTRVLTKGGNLYITVPVDAENGVYFNAHRAFTREKVLSMFFGLTLVSEQYLYGKDLQDAYGMNKGFGTGMFYFIKK